MIPLRTIPLILRQVLRYRVRTLLTASGVAAAMFLFTSIQAVQKGVEQSTRSAAGETTLVVYRENRFCPFTSRLPDQYQSRIARIPGVRSVIPMRIYVNNCRASLDVVTFRGVPVSSIDALTSGFDIVQGSVDGWKARDDASLVGEALAKRRGLAVGDPFTVAGISTVVAGVIRSSNAQDQNVAYVTLGFLQRAASKGGDGVVTQFNVRVDDASKMEEVARAIDAEFKSDQDPTSTTPEQAFVARAASDLIRLVGFTRYLAWACLAAVLALVGNAIVLSVQDRIREHAVLQTLGFRAGLIARMVVVESAFLSLLGGLLGAGLAAVMLREARFALTVDGVNIAVAADWGPALLAVALAALLGVFAGLVPAWRASRVEIAQCFRAI